MQLKTIIQKYRWSNFIIDGPQHHFSISFKFAGINEALNLKNVGKIILFEFFHKNDKWMH